MGLQPGINIETRVSMLSLGAEMGHAHLRFEPVDERQPMSLGGN